MATKKKTTKSTKAKNAKTAARGPARSRAKKASRMPAKKAARKAAPAGRVGTSVRRPAAAAKKAASKTRAKKGKATARKAAKTPAQGARAKALLRREDRAGHLDPQYAAELRRRGARPQDPTSFIERPRSQDDLVEELGEEYVASATAGAYEAEDAQNQDVPEEIGGPFVETTDRQEFAQGTDPSNPKGATREPFPRT